MTVLELEGRRSGRDRQQLVAQTDAEDRLAQRDRLADVGDRRPALLRVAGAVRQHHAVVVDLREVVVPRHADHRRVPLRQAAHDVVFAAAVDQYDPVLPVSVRFDLFRADERRQVLLVRIDELRGLGRAFDHELAEHDAPLADDLRDPARVHAPNARHAVVLEPLSEAFARVPVAVLERIVGDDQSADVDTVRFEKAQQTVLLRKLRNSVVADQRIGRHEDLTAVRRVGQAFGITGHGCVEDDFARNGRFGAEGVPFELSAVLEDQTGGFFVRHYLSVSYGLSSLAETVFWLRIVSESQRYG